MSLPDSSLSSDSTPTIGPLLSPPFHRWMGLALIALLLGRSWQYFFWITPYESLGAAWQIGLGLVLLSTVGLYLWRQPNWMSSALLLCSLILLLQALGGWAAHAYEFTHLIEHSLAWSTPLLLWLVYKRPGWWPLGARLAVALTFTGHGLYALGWPFPTPPHFLYMTQTLTGFDAEAAQQFLQVAGGLDLLIAVGIFLPKLARPLLAYACFWGLATALARPLSYVSADQLLPDLHRWLMEMVYRLPHSLVPLALLVKTEKNTRQ